MWGVTHKIATYISQEKFISKFNKFIIFLISTSLFLAITGSLKVLFASMLINIFAINITILTFLSTLSVYGLNKLTDLKEDTINLPERANIIIKFKPILKISVVLAFILTLILGFLTNVITLPILFFPLFLGILYSMKISKNLPRLKDITGVKNITIALSWAVVSTFLPLIYLSKVDVILTILIFYLFFIKSFINSVLFDVRDIEGDKKNGVRTIPVFLGRHETKNILLLLNSTLILWLIFSYFFGFFDKYFPILIFSVFYGYWYILYFCREGGKIGKSMDLLVDGEWLPTVILALLFIG